MTQSAILQQSTFSTGEVSPALYGRVDLQRYTSSLRLLKNMYVKSEGGATKRPGTRFVAPTKGAQSVNLIPFQPTSSTGYMIEFGDQYARFHLDGVLLLDTATDVVTTDIHNNSGAARFLSTGAVVAGDQYKIVDNDGVNLLKDRFVKVSATGLSSGTHFQLEDWETGDMVDYDVTMDTATITLRKPLEIATPYLAADVGDLNYAQSVDVLYIAHPSYPQHKISRTSLSPLTFAIEQIFFNPNRLSTPAAPVAGVWTYEGGGAGTLPNGASVEAYVITTVDKSDESFATESLPSTEFTGTRDANWADTAAASVSIVLPRIGVNCDANSTHGRVYKRSGGAFLFIGEEKLDPSTTVGFRDRNLQPSASSPSPPSENDFFGRVVNYGVGTAGVGGSGPVADQVVTFSGGATARVVNAENGTAATGSVTVTPLSGTITTSDTITNWGSGTVTTPASVDSITDNYPSTVTFYEDRLCWAASNLAPQTVWTSQSGDYQNLTVSKNIVASDAIEFTVNSRQLNKINSMVAMDDLLLMTSGAVWSASGAGDNEPIAPDSIKVRVQSYAGAEGIAPVLLDDSVLFVESKSQSIRDLNYEFTVDRYNGNDLSVMSRHLVEDYDITSWCSQKVPHGIIWATRSDGKVLSLTYLREHDVRGWAQHSFGDSVSVISSVSGVQKDDVYMVVTRGARRHIEFLQDRRYGSSLEDAWFADDGVAASFSGKSVWGLWHLEGETLSALVDGEVEENLVVSGGAVTLTNAATSKVIIGEPFTGELTTLDLDVQSEGGALSAQRRRISKVFVRVVDTRGLFASEDGSSPLNELKQRRFVAENEIVDTEGVFEIVPAADWSRQGRVHLEFPYPLPAEVTSIMPKIVVGG